jgi:hypothetical protein
MSDRLMNAIFSMDAYNRGYGQAVKGLDNGTLGTATRVRQDVSAVAVAAGFYAVAG